MEYPMSPAQKPVYYFTEDGREVTYIEHAAFISSRSYSASGRWFYPMLVWDDQGECVICHLIITRYEWKPFNYEEIKYQQKQTEEHK